MLEQAAWRFSIQLKISAARDGSSRLDSAEQWEENQPRTQCIVLVKRDGGFGVACIAHQRLCLNLDIARALDEMRADERPRESRNGAGDGFMDDRPDAFLPSARRLRPS